MRYLLNKDWGVIEKRLTELRAAGLTESKVLPDGHHDKLAAGEFRVKHSKITQVWKLEYDERPGMSPPDSALPQLL